MRKYLSLYSAFFRASLTADVEFRANFIIKVITDIFWYVAQIVSFEVLFNYTSHIGDWDRMRTRIFLGVLFVVDSLYMVVFSTNVDFLSDAVRKGSLDLLLTKPVNSQFIISCQRVSTAQLVNLLMGMVWLIWSLSALPEFSWFQLGWLVLLLPCGAIIFYTLRFFFASFAVIFTRAENIQYLWWIFYKLGMRPDNIYFPWLKYILLTIIPVGLIASVPSRLLLNIASPWLALWCVFMTCFCLFLSHLMWNLTLKSYSSASS